MRLTASSALSLLALLGALAASGGSTSAATMTFDGIAEETYPGEWVEDGVTASGNGSVGYWQRPNTFHMGDGAGDGYSNVVTFTMATRFRPVGFDLFGGGSAYISPEGVFGTPFDSIRIQAFRSGAQTFSTQFYAGDSGSTRRFELPDSVGFVDSLVLSSLLPDVASLGGECNDFPCSEFNVDNVELTPVPLPLPAALLAGGMGALVLLRRGRRTRRPL